MKSIQYLSVGAFVATALLCLNLSSYTSGGPEDGRNRSGYTGGPAENGRTCGENGGCHNTASTSREDIITFNIPETGINPGETYQVSVNGEDAGVSKWGFQISVQDKNGVPVGTFSSVTNETRTQLDGTYATHTSRGTQGDGSKSWDLNWLAPESLSGDVTFYAVVNASNGDGSTRGDKMYKQNRSVTANVVDEPTSIQELDQFVEVIQSSNQFNILNANQMDLQVELVDINGRILSKQSGNQSSIRLTTEFKGIVILVVSHLDQKFVRKFII